MACRRVIKVGERVVKDFAGEFLRICKYVDLTHIAVSQHLLAHRSNHRPIAVIPVLQRRIHNVQYDIGRALFITMLSYLLSSKFALPSI